MDANQQCTSRWPYQDDGTFRVISWEYQDLFLEGSEIPLRVPGHVRLAGLPICTCAV